MPHPYITAPNTPTPWAVYASHCHAHDSQQHDICAQFAERRQAITWAHTHPYPRKGPTPQWIQRLDIPAYLCSPADIMILSEGYATNPAIIAFARDQGLLPTMYLSELSSYIDAALGGEIVHVQWHHQLPDTLGICLHITSSYTQVYEDGTLTLTRISPPTATIHYQDEDGQRYTYNNRAPDDREYFACVTGPLLEEGDTSLHRLIRSALQRHPNRTEHQRLQSLRAFLDMPDPCDPHIQDIVAPSYRMD